MYKYGLKDSDNGNYYCIEKRILFFFYIEQYRFASYKMMMETIIKLENQGSLCIPY